MPCATCNFRRRARRCGLSCKPVEHMAGTTTHHPPPTILEPINGSDRREVAGATGKFAVCVVPPFHSFHAVSPQLRFRFRHSPTTDLASINSSVSMPSRYHDCETRRDRSVPGPHSILMETPCRCSSRDTPPRPLRLQLQLRYGPCPSRTSPVVPSPAKSERCFFLVGQTARRPLTGQRQRGGEPWHPVSMVVPRPRPGLTWRPLAAWSVIPSPQLIRSSRERVFAELDASIDFVLTGPRQPCPPFGCQSQRR